MSTFSHPLPLQKAISLSRQRSAANLAARLSGQHQPSTESSSSKPPIVSPDVFLPTFPVDRAEMEDFQSHKLATLKPTEASSSINPTATATTPLLTPTPITSVPTPTPITPALAHSVRPAVPPAVPTIMNLIKQDVRKKLERAKGMFSHLAGLTLEDFKDPKFKEDDYRSWESLLDNMAKMIHDDKLQKMLRERATRASKQNYGEEDEGGETDE